MKQSKAIVECKKAGTGELCIETCPLYEKCWLKNDKEEMKDEKAFRFNFKAT
jgi:hypothetical protein